MLHSHIDFGLHARSRFQHGGAVWSPPSLGGVACLPLLLRGAAFLHHLWVGLLSPLFCWVVLLSLFLEGAAFLPLLLWAGLLFHLLLRAAAFLLLLWVGLLLPCLLSWCRSAPTKKGKMKTKENFSPKISKRRENRKKASKRTCAENGG